VPIAGLWLAAGFFTPWQATVPLRLGSLETSWHVSAEMAYLGFIQLISGIVWAAYELAMLLMFFEAIPRHDRPSVLTFYNFGNAAAQVVGALIGATILQLGHEAHGAYLAIFGISSLARLCTVPLLGQTPERAIEVTQPALRVIAVRGGDDSAVGRPILSSLSDKVRRPSERS
jgi:MFS family permease